MTHWTEAGILFVSVGVSVGEGQASHLRDGQVQSGLWGEKYNSIIETREFLKIAS